MLTIMGASVFFSWQADDMKQTNRLRNAIRKVLKALNRQGLVLEYDEATRGAPGSPDIRQVVLGKIERANIVIADVSLIAAGTDDAERGHSNSNVMFELGYATAVLGVDRIITITATPMNSLPFDISNHRAAPIYDRISDTLKAVIELIIQHNPPSEWEARVAEPAQRVHERDNIRRYLSCLPLDILGDSLSRLPEFFHSSIPLVTDDLNAIKSGIGTELPTGLQSKFDRFLLALNNLAHLGGERYRPTPTLLFRAPKDYEDPEADLVRAKASQIKWELDSGLRDFISAVRAEFPELNYTEISNGADSSYKGLANQTHTFSSD